ncbi:MAG: prolyl oligopeptidase family serine peptidase, partial [Bacteroidales bacterium]|nr:prolyl oligopeptidase family serine peptidase [Bacteroidales bacterium]
TEHRPYSYMETHRTFPSKQFIMDLNANMVKMLNDGTVKPEKKDEAKKDEKAAPKPTGFAWRYDLGAVLTWTETKTPASTPAAAPAADSKDKKAEKKPEATHTTLVYQCGAPFNFESDKKVVANPEFRMSRITWGNSGLAIYQETSTDKKVRRTVAFVPCDTLAPKKVLFEETTEIDTVGTFPVFGSAYTVKNAYGKSVVWSDAKNTTIYLSGTTRRDAEGWNYSFLDKLTLKTGAISNVWSEKGNMKHTLVAVSDFGKNLKILETMEAFDKVPDLYETDVKKGSSRQITHIQNSVPQVPELITKTIVSYTRKDGLKCFGSLYLPKGYDPAKDGKLPVFMWTYPYEYKTFAESEKVRPDRYKYLKPTYGSAQIWATQGYAVLDEFTMAIIPHHKDSLENDVFLEQLIMSAESAIDFVVDSLGIGDRDRIGIGGHSYGGFMTANLLSHTRLFRAGVARSGAYMRSLTPFGFQSERRNYWKAKSVYDEMSPFNYADQVKDALLVIHGMQDDNMGTFPVQSERLYQALAYFGATARFVQLPYEAHSYLGRETTLDMLYETGAWIDKYVKNAEPKKESKKDKEEESK